MEFPNIGQHCQVKSCEQLDFLPFKCQLCKGTFCLDHRKFDKHNCPNMHLNKDRTVPLCPICSLPVMCLPDQSPDDAVWKHIQEGCTEGVKKREREAKCHVKKCKEVPFLPIICNNCGFKFCAQHRLASDHYCKKKDISPKNTTQQKQIKASA